MYIDMNIYISKQNEERLRQEPSMSGLINLLLDRHYEFYKPGTLIEDVTDKSVVGNEELAAILRDKHAVKPASNKGIMAYIEANNSDDVNKEPFTEKMLQEAWDSLPDNQPIITSRNKDMDFCKHGAVKGFCKKGCK